MAVNLEGYRITLLCEDDNYERFIRAYLKLHNIGHRCVNRISTAFNNATVLRDYSSAVESYREKCKENVALIVMIDADKSTIQQQLREFDKKLDYQKYQLNKNTRSDNEKILIFVPIRNIESWFYYIDTGDFNVEINKDFDGELIDYKKTYYKKRKPKPFELAEKLKTEICINGLPENAPSSLHHACDELKRLKI